MDAKTYAEKQIRRQNIILAQAKLRPNVSKEELDNIKNRIDIYEFFLLCVNEHYEKENLTNGN